MRIKRHHHFKHEAASNEIYTHFQLEMPLGYFLYPKYDHLNTKLKISET